MEGRAVKIDAALPDTQRGRDVATMVRNGTFTGLSIEFRSTSEGRTAGGVREVRAARLMGAAVVDSPSYQGALEVREGRKGRIRVWL